MVRCGYHDWTLNMRPGHDSYCWIGSRQIDLGMDYDGDARQILLHEIAHIGAARFCNQKHNAQFWAHLKELTRQWLKQGLDEPQLCHKSATGGGIYAVCYGDNAKVSGCRIIGTPL